MADFDRAALEQLAERAAQLAPELVGLDEAAARARVAAEDGLSIRVLADGQPVTLEFRYGRITVTIRAGVVLSATVG